MLGSAQPELLYPTTQRTKSTAAFIDDLFCYPYTGTKNESFLWLAALKQKSLFLADASPLQARGTYYLCVHSFNECLLSTSTVLSANFYQKTPYLVPQGHIKQPLPWKCPRKPQCPKAHRPEGYCLALVVWL